MSDAIDLSFEDSVATITIDDPERLNPLSRERYAAILDCLATVEDSDARCLVFTGAGHAFSSGGDVEGMGDALDDRPPASEEIDEVREHEQRAIERVVEFPLPTVAKVDGPATADGAALAVACDLTLASERARIGFPHIRFGLSLDAGVSYLLPRVVGEKHALDLALTGRVVDAETAHEMGLFSRLYPADEFDERADDVIERLAGGPPVAARHVKRLVRDGLDAPLDAALDNEASVQAAMFGTADYREGVRAFLDDREPEFEGR
ncbi:MAG: enoyl-CoA hydratase/isomerase family protein [Haloarculaceae archaeon]